MEWVNEPTDVLEPKVFSICICDNFCILDMG